jgi:hypothetical protein
MKKLTAFWDRPLGKLLISVSGVFVIAIIWWLWIGATSTYEGAKDGAEAIKKIQELKIQSDSLCRKVNEREQSQEVFLEKQAIRDSFMCKRFTDFEDGQVRINEKLDRILMKK